MSKPMLELPEGFEEYAWEVEAKGWFQGAIAVIAAKRYQVVFYDPTRLAQEIAFELERRPVFLERNVIVVPEVTRARMEAAIELIASMGLERDMVPDEEFTDTTVV